MGDDERLVELEIKVAYQDRLLAELDSVVREQHARIDALEQLVRKLQESVVKAREGKGEEVLGAFPEEDPVPRSG